MSQKVVIAGYQGPRSILTRGLTAFAEASLPSADLVPDVTADGLPAQRLFDGLESGEFNVGYMASGYLTRRVPALGVLDVPFSIADRQDAYDRLDGEAGSYLAKAVADKTNLIVLAFWDNGFRHLSNSVRPLRTPADCEGLKVRTLNNQMYQDTMAAIGFEPVVTDVKELVSACRSGEVQAQENPLTNMLSFGLDRWHSHVSLTGHIYGVILLVANKSWFSSLKVDFQKSIKASAANAADLQRNLAAIEDVDGLNTLQSRGIGILRPEELDIAGFRSSTNNIRQRALANLPADLCRLYLS